MSHDETKYVTGYASLGYPQPQPLPPPQQGYGHPYSAYPNLYNAAVLPPQGTAYYSSAQLPNGIASEPTRAYAFARVALVLMIAFIVCTLSLSVFTWLIFVTNDPQFKIESFSVPYFEITNSTLNAGWEINLTVTNPNHKLIISFEDIEGSLSYKEMHVDSTMMDSLHLDNDKEGRLNANFYVPHADHITSSQASLVNLMTEDRKNGNLDFDLGMFMKATFISGSLWSKRTTISVLCKDITVYFPAPSGGGTWDGRMGECLTYY